MATHQTFETDSPGHLPGWLKFVHDRPILIASLAFAGVAGVYNFIQEDITLIALVAMLPSAILGFAKPKRAWLWSGFIALSIPLSDALGFALGLETAFISNARNTVLVGGNIVFSSMLQAVLVILLVECSAGAGLVVRKSISRFGMKN